MASIHTNAAAMNALATLRTINMDLSDTQNRISTGFKVNSAKDNAAYFSISETMKSDSGMYKAIDEGLTLTKNSISTGRLGAETVADLAQQFVERVAFAQENNIDRSQVQSELVELAAQMQTTIDQATFNGVSMVDGTAGAVTVVTGITRAGGTFATTSMTVNGVDLQAIQGVFAGVDVETAPDLGVVLGTVEAELSNALDAAASLGVGEKAIETQQEFLKALTERIDNGIGAMIDADMEEEAARLQALQVQQQLATQSLSIANQAPQNILSLFR